jgi:hypothetical protein
MQTREIEQPLSIASLAALVAAGALLVPVIERIVAAAWQWHKFAGYSNDGHISLSLNTALFFSSLLAATFGFALCVNRIAAQRSAHRALAWSLWAMYVTAAAAAAYWLLGLSSLNAWRA